MGKFKNISIIFDSLKHIGNFNLEDNLMMISFDVYTRKLESALNAYSILDSHCTNIRIGKDKRYDAEKYHYNVYGSIDTAKVGVLHEAFADEFVDQTADLD